MDSNCRKILENTVIKGEFSIPVKHNGQKFKLSTYVVKSNGMTFYAIENNAGKGFKFNLNFE